ncbi:AzlD domain-containing protein [Kineosporia babensis]|uniref:AzlD domain-containing protein n=1 Tax=Kineosporia babensis TaxID=499548 RepID=A0A9X1SW41_9ACTN|nr:AzlD domain-containing protein [Kineosporia babensis]MCD5314351.1 AzlD domain-containing protein [Kineosporia babensis]
MSAVVMIALVGLAAFLPRYLPFVVLQDRKPSATAKDLLGYAPVAVLAALAVPPVLTPTGDGDRLTVLGPYLAGALVIVVVAYTSRHLLLSALAGTVVFFVLRAVMGS